MSIKRRINCLFGKHDFRIIYQFERGPGAPHHIVLVECKCGQNYWYQGICALLDLNIGEHISCDCKRCLSIKNGEYES